MILALNIGNSNITFGGYTPDGKLVFSSRLFADTALSSDELLYKIVNMLALYGRSRSKSRRSSFPAWCRR